MTVFGKYVVGALVAAVLLGAALVYWRSAGTRGGMSAVNTKDVLAIAGVVGLIAYFLYDTFYVTARAHADDRAMVEASNEALRSLAARTGLSYQETPPYEHPIAGAQVLSGTVTGAYRGVTLRVTGYGESDGYFTVVIVPGFPVSAGLAMRAAMGRRVRLRAKAPAGAAAGLAGGLPSALAQRLGSRARDIIVDDERLMYRVEAGRRPPFWKDEGEYPYRLETDPDRLQAVLEDVYELVHLAGGTVVQDRPLTEYERRIADLERRIAERKGKR
jgi:hypothetical protein